MPDPGSLACRYRAALIVFRGVNPVVVSRPDAIACSVISASVIGLPLRRRISLATSM
jgi:hypothetical protein